MDQPQAQLSAAINALTDAVGLEPEVEDKAKLEVALDILTEVYLENMAEQAPNVPEPPSDIPMMGMMPSGS